MADLPNLPALTATDGQNTHSTQTDGTATQTGGAQTGTQTSSTQTGSTQTGSTQTGSTGSTASATSISAPSLTSTGGSGLTLTGLPTLAGAGIPVLEIPYTANAPFMQKSTLPEGTVFIAVGGVLAFLGACVLLWRGLIAWSINRSVRRAALASIGGSEKASTYWTGTHKGGTYTEITGSNMSLTDLSHSAKRNTFRDDANRNSSTPPAAGLFFSPTAQATGQNNVAGSRNSSYLPAGYYASPSAHAGGGAGATTIGGNLAPYGRHSIVNPSPPDSPNLTATGRPSTSHRATSRDGLKPHSRHSHETGRRVLTSGYYNQPNGSSLMTGSTNDLAGQRAPSAYLEDLFENHGNGPRERF